MCYFATCVREQLQKVRHAAPRESNIAFCELDSLQCSYMNFMRKCHKIQSQGVIFSGHAPRHPSSSMLYALHTIDSLLFFTVHLELT